jgi:hypothetical protein
MTTQTALIQGAGPLPSLNEGFRTGFLAAAVVSAIATLVAAIFIKQKV